MPSPLLPLLLALSFSIPLAAQDKPTPVRLTPLRVSPATTLSQDIGISRIEINFSRPAVKGRKIWGGLVPFGEVWRTGANGATVITFNHPAKVGGKEVPAGSYAFFAIPGEKAWTLILNKKAKQWGASEYNRRRICCAGKQPPSPAPSSNTWTTACCPWTQATPPSSWAGKSCA